MVLKSILGLILKRAVAGHFGAGVETDAYFAAFTIPQQLGDFVIGGIVFKIVIPVFQERREKKGKSEAIRDVAGVLNFSALILLILTVVYYFLIPHIIPLLFSGFNKETMALTITLSRWFAPAIILMGLSLIYVAFYHAHKSFLVPALSTLLFPLISLASLYFLPFDWGIMRLVYGNLIGVSAGILFLIIFLGDKFKWCWNWNLSNPVLKTTMMVAWPLLVANIIGKIIPFVQKNAASHLPDSGNISLLEYAFFLSGTVFIFIASPITTALFPLMGEQKARGDEKELLKTFHLTVKVITFLALPCAVFFAVESQGIVALLLKNGKFSLKDTEICAGLISIITIMIIPQSINLVMNNMFLVYKETKKIAVAGSIIALLSIPLYYFLADHYGIYGIAMAYSAVYTSACLVNLLLLQSAHNGIIEKSSFFTAGKFIVSGLLMYGVIKVTASGIEFESRIINVLFLLSAGVTVYLIMASLLKINCLKFIFSRLLSKFE
jgi:putative peptidoglycan lipid II flippase